VFHDAVLDGHYPPASLFTHLKTLTITTRGGLGILDTASVFKLPSIEIIVLHGFGQPFPMAKWSVPKSSCNMKDLRLEECVIHSTALVQILGSIKALKIFGYDYCAGSIKPGSHDNDSRSHRVGISWSQIWEALHMHRHTLEELCLRELVPFDQDLLSMWYPNGRRTGTLPSLNGLHEAWRS
jgi:hypothetical protein